MSKYQDEQGRRNHENTNRLSAIELETKRKELLKDAARKGVIHLRQYDVFQDGIEDSVMHPDKDGDCIMSCDPYDLAVFDGVRVRMPIGYSRADAIRALQKVIKILKHEPEIITEIITEMQFIGALPY